MNAVTRPYERTLTEYVGRTPTALVLSADLTESCNIAAVRQQHPGQFLSMGMAEQNMIGVAGGLAREGLVPFVHSFGVFLYRRALDQIAIRSPTPASRCGWWRSASATTPRTARPTRRSTTSRRCAACRT